MIRFIKKYALKYWIYYAAGFIALVLTNYISTVIPLKIKTAIDLLSQAGEFSLIKGVLVQVIYLALILALTRTLSRLFIFYPGRFVEHDLRNDLFKHLLGLSASFYRKNKIGDLISRMINDIQSLRANAALGFLHIVNTVMIYSFVIYQMVMIHSVLTFWILLPIPILMFFVWSFVRYMYKYVRQRQQELGDFTNFFLDMFSSIRVVKTAVAEKAVLNLFDKKNDRYFKTNILLARIRSGMFPFIGIIGSVGYMILLLVGGRLMIDGHLTVGEFVAMGSYITLLSWPTASMAWIINIIQRGKVAWERIESILLKTSDFKGARPLRESSTYDLSLRNLSFNYNDGSGFELRDISLSIKAGQVIGLFGPSGSGKTSLLNVIAGLEKVSDDSFLVNGRCLNGLDIRSYYQRVGWVSQNPFLFSSSISKNISFQDQKDDVEILPFSELACVDQDVHGFTQKYDTVIGEKGVILSGGQKSRLALSRAYYKQASILILDDVLSAVDHDTEKKMIDRLLSQKKPNQTIIIVSHRISALVSCDTVFVMKEGQIMDSGSHEELIEKDDLYKYTWSYQQKFE
ncbi:hypothetical protein DID78_02890 [Candidatus Marinamargulisbacteria bacterium SCGC AG-343-D04]|nr:hypothetical protein DID78_02890 [Candidatus Marinamargulisbacteria bacterium SCGC AG-343-D04]